MLHMTRGCTKLRAVCCVAACTLALLRGNQEYMSVHCVVVSTGGCVLSGPSLAVSSLYGSGFLQLSSTARQCRRCTDSAESSGWSNVASTADSSLLAILCLLFAFYSWFRHCSRVWRAVCRAGAAAELEFFVRGLPCAAL
jgi:hypothetical protein